MITTNPLFISAQGGSITCFKGDSGQIFNHAQEVVVCIQLTYIPRKLI